MILSIVIPVFKAEYIIDELIVRIQNSISQITEDYELILIEDFSPDNSWSLILKYTKLDSRIKGLKLSRNFGQQYAITAGLDFSKGDWIVVMDCDLQDQPEEIYKLYRKALEGYDIVFANRKERKDKFFKRLSSKIFHKIYRYFSGIDSDEGIANFGIYSRKVINEFKKLKEKARSFSTLIGYLGFSKTKIDVEHAERYEGKSTYTFSKLIELSLDVVLSNSNKPLKLSVGLGFIMSFVSIILGVYNLIAHYSGMIDVPGYTSTIFSIWFVGGLLTFVLGIVGLYIGKIFDQVKDRQLYIVDQCINIDSIEN